MNVVNERQTLTNTIAYAAEDLGLTYEKSSIIFTDIVREQEARGVNPGSFVHFALRPIVHEGDYSQLQKQMENYAEKQDNAKKLGLALGKTVDPTGYKKLVKNLLGEEKGELYDKIQNVQPAPRPERMIYI